MKGKRAIAAAATTTDVLLQVNLDVAANETRPPAKGILFNYFPLSWGKKEEEGGNGDDQDSLLLRLAHTQ